MKKVPNKITDRIKTWIAESPSTRDIRLISYQIKVMGLKRMLKPYDDVFFQELVALKPGYQKLASLIMDFFKPESVSDFGCGNGFVIETLASNGVSVTGIEGSAASLRFVSDIIKDRILLLDLTKPQKVQECDLAISTEVAEHLPKKVSDIFVSNIARGARNSILFSAAQPGQWGDGHINCQPKGFWINLFEKHGWVYQAASTQQFISQASQSKEIAENMPWMVNNFMIFSPWVVSEK